MKHLYMLFVILIVFLSCSTQEQPSEYVNIPDESLAKQIRYALDLEEDEPVPEKRLKELTELELGWSKPKILDLTGLEKATGLTSLRLTHAYDISEITPLAKLTNLQTLAIYDNSISDISPLAELTQLKSLTLLRGYTHDITPISNLTQLTELRIAGNPITDITTLAGLTQLTNLSLYDNLLIDISPLTNLKKLTDLDLSDNQIRDISPLANLKNLTSLWLRKNNIVDISPLAELTELIRLWINDNHISDISPLAKITQLKTFEFRNNPLISIAPLANMKKLTDLVFYDPISDISPLADMIQLKTLTFHFPPTDITPLAGLINLNALEFYKSEISDITPLSGLTELKTLKLYQNQIQDITPLSGIVKLEKLELHKNKIRDITPLAGMTELIELRLEDNQINDITPLAGLTQLKYLGLEQNNITDVSPIENFTNLKVLYLKKNPIRDYAMVHKIRTQIPEMVAKDSPFPSIFPNDVTVSGLPPSAITRLGKSGINVMRFSPDGKYLVVGSDIGLWVYDVATGEEIPLSNKVIGQINAVAFTSDSRVLACGGYSNSFIQLWDMKTGKSLTKIPVPVSEKIMDQGSIRSVLGLTFSKDEITLIGISESGLITYWDMSTYEIVTEHRSGDGFWSKIFGLTKDGRTFARGFGNGEIRLLDTLTGRLEAEMRGHKPFFGGSKKNTGIRSLAFSSDGNTFASGSEDMTVRLWNTKRRSKRATLKGHTGWVTAVAFSKDGNTVASGDTDGTVRIWDVRKKRELTKLEGHANTIVALTFAPDGKTLASGSADGTVRFWDVNAEKEVSIFATGYTEWVRGVAFSADDATLSAVMFNNTVQRYDVQTGKQLKSFSAGQQNLTHAVALSSDGTLLACHPVNGQIVFNAKQDWHTDRSYQGHEKIQVWDLKTGKELPSLINAFGVMAFSPDNKLLACSSSKKISTWISSGGGYYASGSSDEICLWDVRTGQNIFRFNAEDSRPNDPLAFSPDNTKLVSTEGFGPTHLWDVGTDHNPITITEGADAVAFSPDGSLLATIRSYDIFLWDTATGKKVQELPIRKGEGVAGQAITFSPDGTILLVPKVSHVLPFCLDTIELFDIETGKKLLSLPGHTEPIETLVFSHDGKTLASGSQDGTVLLWDWEKVLRDVMLENRWPNER